MKKYVYTGDSFSDEDIKAYRDFKLKEELCQKIKKDIYQKISSIKIDGQIKPHVLTRVMRSLPFTDKYFKFHKNTLSRLSFSELYSECMNGWHKYRNRIPQNNEVGATISVQEESITNQESFSNLYHLLVNNHIVWLLLLRYLFERNSELFPMNNVPRFSHCPIDSLINNMNTLSDLAKIFSFDATQFKDLVLLDRIRKEIDGRTMAILSPEIIGNLYKCPTNYNIQQIYEVLIECAREFVYKTRARDKSTIPFVKGATDNYQYSVYDPQDETLLTGMNSQDKFRIDGDDCALLHYCVFDKNGIILKITDHFGNMIARANGFRNGNCVFFNQLITIYDRNNHYNEEKIKNNGIIETFQKACEDIVSTSQNCLYEEVKIEHVFVTNSHLLKSYKSNVPDDVAQKIGDCPMDNVSEDWKRFADASKTGFLYFLEPFYANFFKTDYGQYDLICMASTKKNGRLVPRDIQKKDVLAVYNRPRSQVIKTNQPDNNIVKKINQINALQSCFESYDVRDDYTPILIPEGATIFMGDNWYTMCQDGKIIRTCILKADRMANWEHWLATHDIAPNPDNIESSKQKKITPLKKDNSNSHN